MQAFLQHIPRSPSDWAAWTFNHKVSHDLIRAAAAAKGVPLTDYGIDPLSPNDVRGWLERHQQLHLDMNAATGQQSSDLLDVDLSKEDQLIGWIDINHQEHFDVEAALGIGS